MGAEDVARSGSLYYLVRSCCWFRIGILYCTLTWRVGTGNRQLFAHGRGSRHGNLFRIYKDMVRRDKPKLCRACLHVAFTSDNSIPLRRTATMAFYRIKCFPSASCYSRSSARRRYCECDRADSETFGYRSAATRCGQIRCGTPHYTAPEIDTMLGTLRKLRDLLGSRKKQLNQDIMRLIASRPRTIGPFGGQPPPPRPSEAAQIADGLDGETRNLTEDDSKITQLLGEAPLLQSELSPTVADFEDKIRKFTSSISGMSHILRLAAKNIQSDVPIGDFIAQQNSDLAIGSAEYYQWLDTSIRRIEAKTQEIRSWR
jgi:hypothetical protein